ncbi:hypothetical protein [Deinococcus cellulosilyticus]|uniref:Metallophosphoesterase n=1 Tax=Deinococcus cellulosilyticus (strain DSM 18568 / NBRC 106333 / KACC 11606 / 5516J-15) TaxID=1223518 RepID=A0A511MZN4_DEIC1|nr:hypothetical protein [Deinococcus cellulosilyticus]GEM45647.1 hypothetical protein DC3_12820 [Deinococcus cellulosilyticus NBRC 106333 = KACC 11606]
MRTAIFGDAHGNRFALEAVLEDVGGVGTRAAMTAEKLLAHAEVEHA